MSPNAPHPNFLESLYFPPTLSSILLKIINRFLVFFLLINYLFLNNNIIIYFKLILVKLSFQFFVDFFQRLQDGQEIQVARPRGRTIAVGEVDVILSVTALRTADITEDWDANWMVRGPSPLSTPLVDPT